MEEKQLVIYVDVDDTLVRSYGTKRIPNPEVIAHIQRLHREGAVLYCWSSGGTEYARQSAQELGILECFVDFLPKPHIMIDDQEVSCWRYCLTIHPMACETQSLDDYRQRLLERTR